MEVQDFTVLAIARSGLAMSTDARVNEGLADVGGARGFASHSG